MAESIHQNPKNLNRKLKNTLNELKIGVIISIEIVIKTTIIKVFNKESLSKLKGFLIVNLFFNLIYLSK